MDSQSLIREESTLPQNKFPSPSPMPEADFLLTRARAPGPISYPQIRSEPTMANTPSSKADLFYSIVKGRSSPPRPTNL
uniref:Uncharacterized protein n=1 Tax=Acrobeloides nanus TaxID=290746 RepID=A0A914CV70_9BILA